MGYKGYIKHPILLDLFNLDKLLSAPLTATMFFYIPIYRVSQITRGPSLQCTWCPRNTPVYMVSQEHSSVHGVPETLQCTWCPKTLQCTLCPRNTPVYIVSQKHSSVHGVPETLQCTWCPKKTLQCTLCPRNTTVFTMLDTSLLRTVLPNNCVVGKRYSSNLIFYLLYQAFRALHAHLLYQS